MLSRVLLTIYMCFVFEIKKNTHFGHVILLDAWKLWYDVGHLSMGHWNFKGAFDVFCILKQTDIIRGEKLFESKNSWKVQKYFSMEKCLPNCKVRSSVAH